MNGIWARLESTLRSWPRARALRRRLHGLHVAYREALDRWSRKVQRGLRRWVYRTPDEVVKSNTKKAFDHFFSQDEFIQTDYLRDSRLEFYECVADHCAPLLTGVVAESGGCRVVDVGCGTGHFLLAIQRRLGEHAELSGLDFSSAAIARARSVVREASFTVADAYRMPFPDDSFDLVTCLETLEHLKKPRVALDELARICKPGGHLVITVPDATMDDWGGHVNFWTAASLKEFLSPLDVGVHDVIGLPEHGALLAHTSMFALPTASPYGSRP